MLINLAELIVLPRLTGPFASLCRLSVVIIHAHKQQTSVYRLYLSFVTISLLGWNTTYWKSLFSVCLDCENRTCQILPTQLSILVITSCYQRASVVIYYCRSAVTALLWTTFSFHLRRLHSIVAYRILRRTHIICSVVVYRLDIGHLRLFVPVIISPPLHLGLIEILIRFSFALSPKSSLV